MTALYDIGRGQAGLRAARRISRVPLADIDTLVVHYSTGEELGQPDDLAWWRSIQRYHMDSRGWDDIGYNFGVHAHLGHRDGGHTHPARILEGRGLGVAGAHAPGWNRRAVGLVVLGDDDPVQDVVEEVRARIVRFRGDLETTLGRGLRVLGHRQTQRAGYTACPGNELQAWIDAGMPLTNRRPPAPEEDEMQLKRGDRGRAVTAFQRALIAEAKASGRAGGDPLPRYGTDGDFGEETENAVKAYQRAAQLPETGRIDGVTAALLVRYTPAA